VPKKLEQAYICAKVACHCQL